MPDPLLTCPMCGGAVHVHITSAGNLQFSCTRCRRQSGYVAPPRYIPGTGEEAARELLQRLVDQALRDDGGDDDSGERGFEMHTETGGSRGLLVAALVLALLAAAYVGYVAVMAHSVAR